MNGKRFVEWLESLKGQKAWTPARAALRRSLSIGPGAYPPAMPYVEPFVQRAGEEGWRREAYYLVAGLYALKDGAHQQGRTLSQALWEAQQSRGSESLEKRFLALLDADRDQIAFRLRQAVNLVDGGLDFAELLDALTLWFHRQRPVQVRWAKEFYGLHRESEQQEKEEVTS